jgi:hypothetical protein
MFGKSSSEDSTAGNDQLTMMLATRSMDGRAVMPGYRYRRILQLLVILVAMAILVIGGIGIIS